MHYVAFLLVFILLVAGSVDADVERITPWLLGINFTLAVFSINFTFFGKMHSKTSLLICNADPNVIVEVIL